MIVWERFKAHHENHIPCNEQLYVGLNDGRVVIRRKNGKEWGYSMADLLEITAVETPDFLGSTVTFQFPLADGRRFDIFEGCLGMGEFARELREDYGILLDFDVPDEPRVIYSRKEF